MSKEVNMFLKFDDEESEHRLHAIFVDDDVELLRKYCANCQRLRDTKLYREGIGGKVNFKWEADEGASVEPENPFDLEFVSSFIHRLRPIRLTNEPASFDKVAARIKQRFGGKPMKRQIEAIRSIVEESPFAAYGQITMGDVSLWDSETIEKWLNAFEYHQDEDKESYLAGVLQNIGYEGMNIVFVQQLRGQCEGYIRLEELARFILDAPDC